MNVGLLVVLIVGIVVFFSFGMYIVIDQYRIYKKSIKE